MARKVSLKVLEELITPQSLKDDIEKKYRESDNIQMFPDISHLPSYLKIIMIFIFFYDKFYKMISLLFGYLQWFQLCQGQKKM